MAIAQPGNVAELETLGFDFRLADGIGTLSVADRHLFGWLRVELIELAIPRLELPLDPEVDAERFQHRRTEARAARLRMTQADLDRYVAGCGDAMAEVGASEIRLATQDGSIIVSGRVREGSQVADLTFHVYLTAHGDHLRLSCAYPRVYGHLDTPAPLVAHRLLLALVRAAAPSPRHAAATAHGLGDALLEPLSALLFRTMPRAGWRLPACRGLPITSVRVRRDEIAIAYGGDEDGAAGNEAAANLTASLARFRDADELLRAGDLDGALRAYRGELAARGPEQPFLVERILSIASARREHFVDGIELARQVVGRWPDYAPAHAAIASIAIAQGDVESAAERYRTLAEASTALGDEEGATRAVLAGARLLRRVAPDQSTALYENVFARRPGHAEAAEALADRYRDEERWHDLLRLVRARLAGHDAPELRSRDHARLAEVMFAHLGDHDAAAAELDQACRLDPTNAPAFERLAEVEIARDEIEAALAALRRAADLHRDRDDGRAEARCHTRAADAVVDSDPARADELYHAALALDPGESVAMRGAARAAAYQGRHGVAAQLWRELLAAGVEAPPVQARFAWELGRNLLADGRGTEARAPLERAAETGDAATRAEASRLLATLAEADGDDDAACAHLAVAIDALAELEGDPGAADRAAELGVVRAAKLAAIGRVVEAAAEYRRVFSLAAPGTPSRVDAARALVATGGESERVWIGELLAAAGSAAERADLLLERARAARAAGHGDDALADVLAAIAEDAGDASRSAALALQAELLDEAGNTAGRADALAARAALGGDDRQRADAAVESAEGWLAADELERAERASSLALSILDDVDAPELRRRALAASGECAWRRRDWAGVDAAYDALLASADGETSAPERARLAHRHAQALEKLGRDDAAARALRELIDDDDAPADIVAESFRVLGDLCDRLGDPVAAAAAIERYAGTDALDLAEAIRADAWYRAGELYRKRPAHRDDAVRCLDEALHLTADHLPALDALERIARDHGDSERVAVILGRKIAATARHPHRQKALLVRLAALQGDELDRRDVAREIFGRALEIDPDYRPALRPAADDARRRGDLLEAARLLARLATALPGDPDDGADDTELDRARRRAAVELAEVLAAIFEDGDADEDATRAPIEVLAELAAEQDELALFTGLETVYRRRQSWSELADLLGRHASLLGGALALPLDLERIEILRERVGDDRAALLATRAAIDRNPSAPALGVKLEALAGAAPPDDRSVDVDRDSAAERDDEHRDAAAERADAAFGEPDTDYFELMALARHELDAGQWTNASELLAGVDLELAPEPLLELSADILEGHGDIEGAARVLEHLARRAAAAGDDSSEHLLSSRLAALRLDHLGDEAGALSLYRRALELRPDDLVAAELFADLLARTGADPDETESARRAVLTIARSTGAGPNEEARALRQLAAAARARDELDTASVYLEEACRLAPEELDVIRERADLAATVGDHATSAHWLEVLAESLLSGAGTAERRAESAGDLLLELADRYYDQLGDAGRAREAMRRAADAFGLGSRRDATLRLLASESATAGAHHEAVDAFEAIGVEHLSAADVIALAKSYQRLGRDQAAIDVLESARRASALSDEGAMLLFALHRHRKRKGDLAASLERGAADVPPTIATTRLLEALDLYEEALGDRDSAQRVRERLGRLAPGGERVDAASAGSAEDLERAAEAAADGDDAEVGATLLSRAIVIRARQRAATGQGPGDRGRDLLERLRGVARRGRSEADDDAPAISEALADALAATAAIEPDRQAAADLLREAAAVRRVQLQDDRGAADALARALALRPDDSALLAELDATLREAGDYAQLASAYELHLGAATGAHRAAPLVELARIYRDVFHEAGRARAYFDDAVDADPTRATELAAERDALPAIATSEPSSEARDDDAPMQPAPSEPAAAAPAPGKSPVAVPDEARAPAAAISVDDELARAAALEARGQLDAAVAHYEDAAASAPSDRRPLEALERLHQAREDYEALAVVLGRQLAVTSSRAARAELAFRRARICQRELHLEAEAYSSLKEAFACAPDDGDIANALRTLAMARGEWALAAELVYREIRAAADDTERGALYLELALIFDQKLLDARQAVINYEQALRLDPDIPAAPRPLARLYELDGRHAEAARMYELAAAHDRDGERGRLLRHAAMNAERGTEPDDARRLYRLATLTADDSDRAAAEEAIRRLEGRDTDSDAAARLAAIEVELSSATNGNAAALHRDALEAASAAGDPAAITHHARALLEHDASDLAAYLALKSRAAQSEDWETLASLLSTRAAAVDDPDERAALYYELGRAYQHDLADVNAAVGAFEQAITASSEHPGALDALAEIAYLRNDWLRAHTLYSKLTAETSSLTADALAHRRGEIAEVLGREEEACDHFAAAVDLFPHNRHALAALSRAALRTGDLTRAIEAQQSLIELIPSDRVEELRAARLQLADLCQRAGETTHAIYYYETVLTDEPKSVTALSNLVALYAAKGDHVGASRVLRSLIALTPSPTQRADLLFRLGELYRDSGSAPDFYADAYLKAVDLDPEHEPALRRLLDHFWSVGDRPGLLDIARDLSRLGALLSEKTGLRSLARVAVVAALGDDVPLAAAIAESIGSEGYEDLGRALLDAVRAGLDPHELARAAEDLCTAAGAGLGDLVAWLEPRAAADGAELLAALRRS